ncbi:MAG: hypothetical protein AAGG99_06705, partial [Pseudomonadota bacterium]
FCCGVSLSSWSAMIVRAPGVENAAFGGGYHAARRGANVNCERAIKSGGRWRRVPTEQFA